MSWHLLEKSLDEVSKQSTVFGKLWITFLFVFRVIAVTRMGDTVYADEQAAFRCNTKQVGCENVCFNEFSPISHVRFWGFQIIIVATPAMMFLVYITHAVSYFPAAKLVNRNIEFVKGKSKPMKSRTSKHTSKTTQSSAKQSTPITSQRSAKKSNKNWTQQKQEMVAKWKDASLPTSQFTFQHLRRMSDHHYRRNTEKESPPSYQEGNNCLFEQICVKNLTAALHNHSKEECSEKRVKGRGQQIDASETPKSFPRRNGLFKEVFLNRIRRHSDGELKSYEQMDYLHHQLSSHNSPTDFHQTQIFSNSPPHYSVIQLSQLTDNTSPWNRGVSLQSDDAIERSDFYTDVHSDHSALRRQKVSKASTFMSQHTRPTGAPSNSNTKHSLVFRKKNGFHPCQEGEQSMATRSIGTKPSKSTSKRSRAPSYPPSDGYLEFARKVDNMERSIAIAYFSQCLVRLLLESGFLYLQYRIFHFHVPELYKCHRWPCPNTVDCYVSRPNEKSLMLYFMFCLTALCILLACCELAMLAFRHCKQYFLHSAKSEAQSDDQSDMEENSAGKKVHRSISKRYDVTKHPYLIEGYNRMVKGLDFNYDEEDSSSSASKSTKSSKTETETEDLQANTFNSQELESMLDNDLAADMDMNANDNEAAEIFV